MKMLIARFHTLIASWLLATVLPSNFMLGGNFFATKKPPNARRRFRGWLAYQFSITQKATHLFFFERDACVYIQKSLSGEWAQKGGN